MAIPFIEQFGHIKSYSPGDSNEDFQTFIIDSNHEPETISAELLKTMFEAGKTIGILGATERVLDALSECTGRKYKLTGKNIFVRPIKDPLGNIEYGYTIFSNYSKDEIFDELVNNKNKIYKKIQKVFKPDTAQRKYHLPPEATVLLYPLVDNFIGNIPGSRSTPISKKLIVGDVNISGYNGPSKSAVNLNVDAYVYLANGLGGDNNYHVIFHSKLSRITPTNYYSQSNFVITPERVTPPEYTTYFYSYGLGITAVVPNGSTIDVQATSPDSTSFSYSKTYGKNIVTKFGLHGDYSVLIPLRAITSNGNPQNIAFRPDLNSMINQKIFPNLKVFSCKRLDTQNQSALEFLMNHGHGPVSAAGEFEMLSYFIVEGNTAENSFPVTFNIDMKFSQGNTNGGSGFKSGDYNETKNESFKLDLAKLTNNVSYNPPS